MVFKFNLLTIEKRPLIASGRPKYISNFYYDPTGHFRSLFNGFAFRSPRFFDVCSPITKAMCVSVEGKGRIFAVKISANSPKLFKHAQINRTVRLYSIEFNTRTFLSIFLTVALCHHVLCNIDSFV